MIRVLDALLFGLLYAVITGSVDPLDWLTGIVIGALLPRPAARPRRLRNLLDMPRFIIGVALAMAGGGATMLKVLATGAGKRNTHEVELPFGEMTETGAAAMTFAISISPGTAVSEFDDAGRSLRINTIDSRQPAAIRSWVRHFYDRYQRHIFH